MPLHPVLIPKGVTSVTGTAPIASSGGTTPAISLNDAGVTLAKMADIATARIIGRTTAATGVPEALTTAQATALLDAATATLKGMVPTPPNNTTTFLRGDATFAAPVTVSGALTYAGGNTPEASTTSTTIADILTATVSIAAAVPFDVRCIMRKGTGAASTARIDMKLNTTQLELIDRQFGESRHIGFPQSAWIARNDHHSSHLEPSTVKLESIS